LNKEKNSKQYLRS